MPTKNSTTQPAELTKTQIRLLQRLADGWVLTCNPNTGICRCVSPEGKKYQPSWGGVVFPLLIENEYIAPDCTITDTGRHANRSLRSASDEPGTGDGSLDGEAVQS